MAKLARAPRTFAEGYAWVLGGLIILIGLVLAAGGAWLVSLGGSPYYVLAGLGLIASGVLIVLGRRLGVWLYLAVFGLTVVWALWEVGTDPWRLMPRVLAPAILAVVVLTALF